MKLTNIILTSLLATGLGFSQAKSDIVGYETLTKTTGFNYMGLRLLKSTEASGTVVSVSGVNVTLSGTPSLTSGTPYIFEVNSGAASGTVIEINTISGAVIELTSDLSSELSSGDSYRIRASHTIASVFGETNSANLTSSGSFTTSDQVWLPDGAGNFEKFAYLTANPFTGDAARWVNESGATIDSTTQAINYTDGIVINALSAGEIVVDGEVKTTATSYAITQNFNYIGSAYPAGSTLSSAFGDTNTAGLTSTGTFSTSDQIWIPNSLGNFDKYAYLAANPFSGDAARWVNETGSTVNAASVNLTSGIIINKAGPDFNANLAQPESYNSL